MSAGIRILFTRFTMVSAHLSIIPEFLEKITLLGFEDIFDVNKAEVLNTSNQSDILFRGIKTSSGNQTARLKSLQGISCWVLDEAEELIDEDIFDTIDLSIREKGVQNRVILILNPTTKEHWIYNRFFQDKGVEAGFNGVKDNICYIHSTYLDNKDNLSKSFLERVEGLKHINFKKYQHKILGGWLDKAEGVVFENWKFGEFNPDDLQTSCGMDFGFSIDPDSLIEVAIDKKHKKIYVKEYIYQNGLKSHELAKIVLDKVDNKLIIADSAEPRLIEDLRHLGVNIKPVKKGTIESGITRMQDYELIVEPESNNIAKELNNYVYADKGSKLYVDSYNHAIDAIRYNVTYHLDNPNAGKYYVQ
ncbi:MAG: putative terminase large subunit [Prokaryotic dsDNA virus sp.]|nr:MAG: putative terminase large subunit [Prokaryotic dsDNA virus sp.]|tara:strand:- start:5548 stop:6630 length:1083 start_codon:yes stop_codon:yes gene_type:complete